MVRNSNKEEITLLKDREWNLIESRLCRVKSFNPFFASVENGKVITSDNTTPYATLSLECENIPQPIKGFITNKTDFLHLWRAFKERTISSNEEVIIAWSNQRYRYKWLKIISMILPKLFVMVCPKGAFELMTNQTHRPDLQGEARFLAERPLAEWKSGIMI